MKVAPQELQAQAQPILDRATDAVASLRALGLKDRDIKKLASSASDLLLGPDKPDGTTVRDKLLKQLEKKIDTPRLEQAATDFGNAHGDPTAIMDLGSVSKEVGVAAGYPCAAEKQTS